MTPVTPNTTPVKDFAWTCLIVLVTAIAATLLRMALAPLVGSSVPFLTYLLGVLFVAWYRGLGAAVLLIPLSAVAGWYFFVVPANPLGPAEPTRVLGFLASSSAAAFVLDLQRRTLGRASLEAAGRRNAENAEREQRLRLETTLASIGDAVVTTDAEGRIMLANRVAQSLLGWSQQELAGRHLDEVFRIVNELTRVKVESPVARVLREGTIVGLANHTLLIARDGTEIPIDDSGAPILGENGRVQGTVLVFRNVSARRRAEAATGLLASIVESSDDAIVSKDLNGAVTSWNKGAEKIFGYSAEEMIGQPIAILAPDDRKDEMPLILERIRRGEPIRYYQTVRRAKGGELIHVSVTISPLRDALGRVIGASKIARDISESKRMEQERLDAQVKAQALASEKALREMEAELARVVRALSVGELAASIAHEVNQPLAGVVTNAEAALRWLSAETPNLHEVKESLALIVRDGNRASAIIRRIREFLKKQRSEMLSLDMNETIQEAVSLAQPELLKRRITLRIDRSQVLPAVRGDRVQLQQVILNLILNGSEAMNSTNGSKELLLTSRQSDDGGVLVAVQDSGVGVKPEELSRLFDPFFTTKETGMGLGLSISKSIVEAHSGRIWAESNQGPGLTVQFSVPPEGPGHRLLDHESGT
jgi:PAS domain S-box-containing protein